MTNEQDNQNSVLLQAIASQYFCTYDVDLVNGRMRAIRVPDDVRELTGDEGDAKEILTMLNDNYAAPESRFDVEEFIDLDTMSARMAGKSFISCEYRSLKYGWCRASFIEAEREAGELKRLIFTAQIIDEAKRKELEQMAELVAAKKNSERADHLLALLSRDYTNVFVVDRWRRTIKGQKLETSVMEDLELERQSDYPYDEFIWTFGKYRTHPDESEQFIRELAFERVEEKLRENGGEFGYNFRILVDGQVSNFRARYVDFPENDEIIIGCISTDEIIANEAKQREILEDALAAARDANRAKTIFLSNMSHDIRTPMNAIIGYTNLASTHMDERERLEDYLNKIKASGDHLLSLINDILDMSRIESGKVIIDEQEVHLTYAMEELKNIIQADAKTKSQELLYEADVRDEFVWCDKLRLGQVILNCLSNAVKFTPVGGTISLKIVQVESERPERASFVFKIKDNGIGMSPDFAQHIFEPFERERTSTVSGIQGTGLGMAITKSIVDLMGGHVEVESEKGKGTEFTIYLSFRKAGVPGAAGAVRGHGAGVDAGERGLGNDTADGAVSSEAGTVSGDINNIYNENSSAAPGLDVGSDGVLRDLSGLSILLVEDNELNLEIATEILTEQGAYVDTAEDGSIAVEIIENSDFDKYDLILMDVQMPVMNGYVATRRIRALADSAKASLPIIAMTANAFEEDRQNALEAGMNDHVAKPIDVSKLIEAISRIVR